MMEHVDSSQFHTAALRLAIAAGLVANHCDHAEHNEHVDAQWITNAGSTLINAGLEIAAQLGVDPIEQYGVRLAQIESANVLHGSATFEGLQSVRDARTWRDLQIVQAEHDRAYHPDVAGLTRADQLRHYAFHVAKLAAAVAKLCLDECGLDEIRDRRMPDMILFGIKLHTVVATRLPESPVADGWS